MEIIVTKMRYYIIGIDLAELFLHMMISSCLEVVTSAVYIS